MYLQYISWGIKGTDKTVELEVANVNDVLANYVT